MSRDLFSRYIWLIDTIRRHGTISRRQIDELWKRSPFSEGEPLPRRTFYNYRNAIEELFGLTIVCDPTTYDYSIGNENGGQLLGMTDWMLNSAAVNTALSDAASISDRIFVEDVPSARRHLSAVIEALKENHPIRFTYHSYSRSAPTPGVTLEPYFLKIFRQRWYVTGRNTTQKAVKTYALDRMSDLTAGTESFEMPADFDPAKYSSDAFGIVFSRGKTHNVSIRANSTRAKYLRALPLHHSQSEMIGDSFSIFSYRLKLTPDLVQELLSLGPSITVLSPPELRAMMVEQLSSALANYGIANPQTVSQEQ